MRRAAFSLIETLIVIVILLLLGALVFSIARPARIAAKRTSCAEYMRQLHQAASLYAIDYDDEVKYPEIPGFTYVPLGLYGLLPYTKSQEAWFCPATPSWIKLKVSNSYGLMLWGNGSLEGTVAGNRVVPSKRKKMIEIAESLGSGTPIIFCPVHDEFEYRSDPTFRGATENPHIYWIGVDGGLRNGKVTWTRGSSLTELAGLFN